MIVHINSNRQFQWALTMCVPFPFVSKHKHFFPPPDSTSYEKSFFFIRFDSWKKLLCAARSTWNTSQTRSQKQWAVYAIIILSPPAHPSRILFSSVQFPWLMVAFFMRNHGKLFGFRMLNSRFFLFGSSKRIALDKNMVMNKKWDSWKKHKQLLNGYGYIKSQKIMNYDEKWVSGRMCAAFFCCVRRYWLLTNSNILSIIFYQRHARS